MADVLWALRPWSLRFGRFRYRDKDLRVHGVVAQAELRVHGVVAQAELRTPCRYVTGPAARISAGDGDTNLRSPRSGRKDTSS